MRAVLVYLHRGQSTFEEGDELEEVVADGVGIGLEALLLAGLFLHGPDETPYTLHDC
jgi:hypothetical protein